MKILNKFIITKTTVWQVSARNGNGAGGYFSTLKSALLWVKTYDWNQPNDDGGL